VIVPPSFAAVDEPVEQTCGLTEVFDDVTGRCVIPTPTSLPSPTPVLDPVLAPTIPIDAPSVVPTPPVSINHPERDATLTESQVDRVVIRSAECLSVPANGLPVGAAAATCDVTGDPTIFTKRVVSVDPVTIDIVIAPGPGYGSPPWVACDTRVSPGLQPDYPSMTPRATIDTWTHTVELVDGYNAECWMLLTPDTVQRDPGVPRPTIVDPEAGKDERILPDVTPLPQELPTAIPSITVVRYVCEGAGEPVDPCTPAPGDNPELYLQIDGVSRLMTTTGAITGMSLPYGVVGIVIEDRTNSGLTCSTEDDREILISVFGNNTFSFIAPPYQAIYCSTYEYQ
jgi:hypothetical protein